MRNFHKTKTYIFLVILIIFQWGVMCTSNPDKAGESSDEESSVAGSPDTDRSTDQSSGTERKVAKKSKTGGPLNSMEAKCDLIIKNGVMNDKENI